MVAPRLNLDKKVQLKKKRKNLTACVQDLMDTKSEWECLSSKNPYALSEPTLLKKSQERNISERNQSRNNLLVTQPPRRPKSSQ